MLAAIAGVKVILVIIRMVVIVMAIVIWVLMMMAVLMNNSDEVLQHFPFRLLSSPCLPPSSIRTHRRRHARLPPQADRWGRGGAQDVVEAMNAENQ